MDKAKGKILIYGKMGHPEVTGLLGHTNNEAIVIRDPKKLPADLKGKDIFLYSQTTMDTSGFLDMSKKLTAMQDPEKEGELEINNTICTHISHREPGLRKFSSMNDVIIFVAGINSSNGRILYEICKSENEETYFISDTEEINPAWFKGIGSVGISGATSTPLWLLEKVAEKIDSFT
jgi:4-hydroxy-3-methylbut-2-en-1-yl diphosphate reductase